MAEEIDKTEPVVEGTWYNDKSNVNNYYRKEEINTFSNSVIYNDTSKRQVINKHIPFSLVVGKGLTGHG